MTWMIDCGLEISGGKVRPSHEQLCQGEGRLGGSAVECMYVAYNSFY